MDTFAERVKKLPEGYCYFHHYYVSLDADIEVPDDAGKVSYKYIISCSGIYLYKEASEKNESSMQLEKKKKREERENRRNSLREIFEVAFETRKSFMKNLYPHTLKNFEEPIKRYAVMCMVCSYSINNFDQELFSKITGKHFEYDEDVFCDQKEQYQQIMQYADKNNLNAILAAIIYSQLEVSNNLLCTVRYDDCSFNENKDDLKRVYEFLGLLGYTISKEEASLLDGTHDLYFKVDDKDEGE